MARKRWAKHVTKAEVQQIKDGLEQYKLECLREQAYQILGGYPEEETIEDWEPLELEDLEGKEYVEPFWTDRRNREKAARLAARKQRQEMTE